LTIIALTIISQIPAVRRYRKNAWEKFMGNTRARNAAISDD